MALIKNMKEASASAAAAGVVSMVSNEEKIMSQKLKAMELVLADGPEAAGVAVVQAWIADFEKKAQAKPESSSASVTGSGLSVARARLGLAPPIRSYKDLQHISYFVGVTDSLHEKDTKEGILEVVAACKPARDALQELRGVGKLACTKMNGVIKSAITEKARTSKKEKENKDAAKKTGKDKRTGDKAAASLLPIFEHAPTVAEQIPVLASGDAPPSDHQWLSRPLILKVDSKTVFEAGKSVRIALDGFAVKFEKMKEEKRKAAVASAPQGPGSSELGAKAVAGCRAQRPLPSDAIGMAHDWVKSWCSVACVELQHSASEALQTAMTPSCFGLAAHYEASSAEKDHLACVRLHFKGTRAVTIAYLSDVFAAIIKKRSLDPTKVKMSEVLGFSGYAEG